MSDDFVQLVPIDTMLETLRCLLRYPSLKDASRIFWALRSPSFPKRVPLGQVNSLDEVEDWIHRSQKGWAEGSAFTWSIERRRDHVLLGQVTLSRKSEPNTWALAFWIHPECWGQGYATEAAERILEFGFLDLNAALIWAGAANWNHASVRTLEKLGMVYVSENPKGYFIDGEPIPTKEFEISRHLWQNANLSAKDYDA